MAEKLDRRDAIVLLGMLLVGACSGAKSKASPGASATSPALPPTIATTVPPVTNPRGHNAYLTPQVLQSDAASYNGQWSAQWSVPASNEHGTIAGTVHVDPVARNFTVTMNVAGPLLGGTQDVAPIAVTVNADSFVYDPDSGQFSIRAAPAIGGVHLHDDGGFGHFVLDIDPVAGHPEVKSFTARGVANRPDAIPVTFRVVTTDGKTRDGTIAFQPAS